jgi:hypothetical protein
MHLKSVSVGERKTIRSSAYKEALIVVGRCRSTPCRSTIEIILMTASMTTTNSIGESGSPCHRPCAWQIFLPGLPFTMILVVADCEIFQTARFICPRFVLKLAS